MLIKSISLNNFRQFREAEIEFSRNPERNITVIHGQNGSGKTTILNAFRWALFDQLQSIKRPDRVANQGAMAAADVGDRVVVDVKLTFEHDGLHHEVRRRKTFQKQDKEDFMGHIVDDDFSVEYVSSAGNVEEPPNPESYVRQVVPENLADLFFFDGEYISSLSGVDNQDEIQQSIRQIMGLTIIQRSIKHLDYVEGKFREELSDAGGQELEELIGKRDSHDSDLEELNQEITDARRKKKQLQSEVQDIEQLLGQLGETRELQEERERLRGERVELEHKVDELNNELESLISEQGFLPFVMSAIEDTADDIDRLRQEGKIPSEVDNEFVDKLLEEEECICGRPLISESDPAERVEAYKSEATAPGLSQAAIRLISHLSHINDAHDSFFEEVDRIIEERGEMKDEIASLRGQIEDIGTKIGDIGEGIEDLNTDHIPVDEIELEAIESPSDLEAAKNAKNENIQEIERELAVHHNNRDNLESVIDELNDEIDQAEAEQFEAELARKRMQVAKAVRNELEIYYEQFQQTIRERASNRVEETFSQVATKDYDATITDEFELRVLDSDHRTPVEVDKSRGERQIASLTFIGSLVDIARAQYESDQDSEYFTGGIYPIVMDSPFGALDKQHRAEISRVLPSLADQVIVMATDSQWEGPVETEMGPKVGAQYKLEFDDSGGVDGTPVTQIEKVERRAEVVG